MDWRKLDETDGRTKYRRLSDRIAAAIRAGDLKPGVKLPSHRDLAYQLGVSIGSVARAYRELAEAGLAKGEIGRGTIVLEPKEAQNAPWIGLERVREVIDLGLANRPPIDDAKLLDAAGRSTLRALGNQWSMLSLGDFPMERGAPRHRRAAEAWLSRRGVPTTEDTVLIMIGAQEAVSSALLALARRGQSVLVESATFASLRDLATMLGLKLHPVRMDADGVEPDDLARQARRTHARIAVVQPTFHIPTTASMSADRRRRVADIARACDLTVIEYEAWSSLIAPLGPPLAALAPERTIYVDGFSNALMPGVRASIVRLPPALASKIMATRYALLIATPDLLSGLVAHWIGTGVATELSDAIARVNAERTALAERILGIESPRSQAPFLWLPTAPYPTPDDFARAAELEGVKVLSARRFSVGKETPPFIRASLCAARNNDELVTALKTIRQLRDAGPA